MLISCPHPSLTAFSSPSFSRSLPVGWDFCFPRCPPAPSIVLPMLSPTLVEALLPPWYGWTPVAPPLRLCPWIAGKRHILNWEWWGVSLLANAQPRLDDCLNRCSKEKEGNSFAKIMAETI